MKKEARYHPKTKKLARILDIPLSHAWGLIEGLWLHAADHAKGGAIGGLTDELISSSIEWTGDASSLVDALVDSGFLERHNCCSAHRLLIHDWKDHCQDSVRKSLRYRGLDFDSPCKINLPPLAETCGHFPPLAESGGKSRKVAATGRKSRRVAATCRLPIPLPIPIPKPEESTLPTPLDDTVRIFADLDGHVKLDIDDPLHDGKTSKLCDALKALGIQAHRMGGRLWNRITTDADSMASGDHDAFANKLDQARAAGMTTYDEAASWIRRQCWSKADGKSNGNANKISRVAAKPGKYDNLPSRLPTPAQALPTRGDNQT